jgi:hypothetical protein
MSAFRGAALALLLSFPAAALAQWLDFAQFDVSEDTRTLVLVKALRDGKQETPDPLLSAAYTKFPNGSTASAAYTHRWALLQGQHNWLVGAGAGINRYDSDVEEDDKSGLSARAQTEAFGPVPGGSYYALAQISSFRRAGFASVQYNLANLPLGFELARYVERGYHHTAALARIALTNDRRWFLRVGVLHNQDKDRAFVGLAYNAF